MPKPDKQEKRPTDVNQLAHYLGNLSTQEATPHTQPKPAGLSAYMAEIGRKGGKIGGKRRLKTMTQEQRTKIARKAAKAKWANYKKHLSQP